MLYALPYCTSFFTVARNSLPAYRHPQGGSKLEAAPPGLAAVALIELLCLAELLLQQWSGPPTVAVTNLDFAVAVAVGWAYSYLATVANAGIGWRGRVLSCNSNLRVPCIGFESILLGCDSLVKFSLSVLCRLVLPTAR
jgi:hypothetical protein